MQFEIVTSVGREAIGSPMATPTWVCHCRLKARDARRAPHWRTKLDAGRIFVDGKHPTAEGGLTTRAGSPFVHVDRPAGRLSVLSALCLDVRFGYSVGDNRGLVGEFLGVAVTNRH
jgi:hypothetical protein